MKTSDPPSVTATALLHRAARDEMPTLLRLFAVVAGGAALGAVPAFLTGRLVDGALDRHDIHALLCYTAGMVAAALAAALLSVVQGRTSVALVQRIMTGLRKRLAVHVALLPYAFFTEQRAGEVLNRVTSDVDSLESLAQSLSINLIANTATVTAATVMLFVIDARLALTTLLVMIPFLAPLRPLSKRMYESQGRIRVARDGVTSAMYDLVSLSGALLFKLFGAPGEAGARIERTGTAVMAAEIGLATHNRWYGAVLSVMMALSSALVWLFGGLLVAHGAMSIGALVAFIALQARLFVPAGILATSHSQLTMSRAVLDRIAAYLSLETENQRARGAVALPPGGGAVELRGVSFAYEPGVPVLCDVSLRIPAGRTIAIVGPSGSGKSTICSLLLKLYEPGAGRILVDGADLAATTIASARDAIGLVTQETYLLHDTIAANLRFAKPSATQAELEAAARRADIHDFIAGLPDGYDTVVGERGSKLSGGQRQRLALARIVLKNPRILILDEATSALDAHTEQRVKDAFREVMRDRTGIIVAHRLSTVLSADLVAVLDRGRIVEVGSVDDLLRIPSALTRLFPEIGTTADPALLQGSALDAY